MFPATERDDVFESGDTTRKSGTGFGLSIVSQIVDARGWEIDVLEADGGGARFKITGVEFGSRVVGVPDSRGARRWSNAPSDPV